MTTAPPDIVREVVIAAPPDAVFPYFTDPEKMIVWKAVDATLDARPGGIFRIDVTGHDVARGEYVEIDPPHRVVFTFGWEAEGTRLPPGSTTVEVTLVPDGDGTRVRLVHSGLPDEIRAGSTEGWDHYLPRLVVAAEGGVPGPDPWADARESTIGGRSDMDEQRNKQNLRRLYDEVMNGHRVEAADDLITPDRPDHDPNLPPEFTEGREGFKRLFRMFIEAFPDLSFQNEHMVAEGDLVASHNLMRGTHRGSFMGIPATGRSFSVYASDVCRFTDEGLISEHWGVFDMGSLLGQLGVAPLTA